MGEVEVENENENEGEFTAEAGDGA